MFDSEILDHSDYALEAINEIDTPLSKPRIPIRAGQRIEMRGWAVDKRAADQPPGAADIGGKIFPCEYGSWREDVAAYFKTPAFAGSGYTCEIPAATLSPGEYVLYLG